MLLPAELRERARGLGSSTPSIKGLDWYGFFRVLLQIITLNYWACALWLSLLKLLFLISFLYGKIEVIVTVIESSYVGASEYRFEYGFLLQLNLNQ